jgi:subtilase family serine protease
MRAPVALLAVVVATFILVSPVASAHTSPTLGTPGADPGPLVTDAVALAAGVPTTPLDPGAVLQVSLTLAYPHPGALDAFLSAVEDPHSPIYRQYLTHNEFETTFAPSPTAVAAVVGVLHTAGGRDVTVAPDRLSVAATLSVAQVDQLFDVSMVYLNGHAGSGTYTATGTPSLPSDLEGLVTAVTGLSNAADHRLTFNLDASRPMAVRGPAPPKQFVANNATGTQWFVGSDFSQAFQLPELLPGNSSLVNATSPTGVAIATLLASGYNETLGGNTPPWDPAVINAYFNDTLGPHWLHSNLTGVPVVVSGITPPLPASFGSVNDSTLDEFENSLDLEMAGSLAPGAPLYNFYFAGSLLASPAATDADVASYFDQDLASALSYNYSPAHLGVVSSSFGITDLNDSTWDGELQEAAAMGVTIVSASGDQGNAPDTLTGRSDGPGPIWPASAAFNTSGSLSVGGVSLTVTGLPVGYFNGTDLNVGYDNTFGRIATLSTWWDTSGGAGDYAGSEGGISAVYPEPDWQFDSAAQPNIVNATVLQGVGALGRAGPDLSFPANATIAYVVADASGNIYFSLLEGTSIAAPAFAGLLAVEIAVSHHSFGFLAPELYRIESYYAAHPGPTNPLYDVTNGSNYVFSAEVGWDATTGWGAPIGPLFYIADANPAIRDYNYTGPTPGLPVVPPPPGVPWTEIFIIFGVGATVAIVLVVVMARPSRNPKATPRPSFEQMPPPPLGSFPTDAYAGPTFLCPFCGAVRPAEPVRCPRCGAL